MKDAGAGLDHFERNEGMLPLEWGNCADRIS